MHFGKWIVVAFVLFAMFIGTLVTICVRQDMPLVSKEYYQEELQYQQQLDRMNNAAALAHQPEVKIIDRKYIEVLFDHADVIESGQLKLFSASNPGLDASYQLTPSTARFEIRDAQRGPFRAKLTWTMRGKEFYTETVVYI